MTGDWPRQPAGDDASRVAVLDDVTIRYPRSPRDGVHRWNLSIDEGSSTLLLGPSGSGKSTLLHALAGVVPQTIDALVTGEITVCGHDPRVTPVAQIARDVAFLQQNPMDQLCLSVVEDELAFGLENRRVPRGHMNAAIARALALVGGSHLRHRRTAELSGGEAQRVALAGTLVSRPRLALLDEPTALLDPVAARRIGRVLSRVFAGEPTGAGTATILIEHRLDEIGPLPSQTAVMTADGGLLDHGPTDRVLREHAATLVAMGCWLPRSLETPVRRTSLKGGDSACHEHPVLRARGITVRSSRGAIVLDDVDLDVHPGEVVAVIGTNGAGKSTLLRALVGLEDAYGALETGRAGLVFQHPEHQFLSRSVRSEIAKGLPRPGRPGDDARVAAVMSGAGLAHLAHQDPFRLSGGQQRRLSLATMAVTDDEVILVDEPTFGQDLAHTGRIANGLLTLARAGKGIVMVSHDLELVAAIADVVLVLHAGRVVAHGPTARVLADHGTLSRAGLAEKGAAG